LRARLDDAPDGLRTYREWEGRSDAVYATHEQHVRWIDRCRFHRDENILLTESRFGDCVEFDDLRRVTESYELQLPHNQLLLRRGHARSPRRSSTPSASRAMRKRTTATSTSVTSFKSSTSPAGAFGRGLRVIRYSAFMRPMSRSDVLWPSDAVSRLAPPAIISRARFPAVSRIPQAVALPLR